MIEAQEGSPVDEDTERLVMKLEDYCREVEEITGLTYRDVDSGYMTPEDKNGKRMYSIGIRGAKYPENAPAPLTFAEMVSDYWREKGYKHETMGSQEFGEITCTIPEVGELSFGYGPGGLAIRGMTLPV